MAESKASNNAAYPDECGQCAAISCAMIGPGGILACCNDHAPPMAAAFSAL